MIYKIITLEFRAVEYPCKGNLERMFNDRNGYVWHCHTVDYEDSEMMRLDEIQPNPNATRPYIKKVDY